MKFIVLLATLLIVGCTDAEIGSFTALGDSADIWCVSGGQEVFRDKSTGKIQMLEGGGWHYRSVNGSYIRTFADCFVEVK